MKTSTATSVFVNYPLHDAIDQVIQAGFEGVDIWCGRPHLFRKDYSPDAIQRLGKKLQKSGLTPVSLMPAFYRYPFSLSSPNDVIRKDSIEYLKDCITNAVLIGAKQVLVVPNHSLVGQTIQDAQQRFVDSLRQVSDIAEKQSIRLGLEVLYPQLSDYLCSSEAALHVMAEIGSDCLGVVMDTGHLNLSGENPENALKNLGDLLLQVHINDNDSRQQQNAIPGEGTFNFSGFIQLLHKYEYDGFLSLELGWGYTLDPYPAVCSALERLHSLIQDQ